MLVEFGGSVIQGIDDYGINGDHLAGLDDTLEGISKQNGAQALALAGFRNSEPCQQDYWNRIPG